MRLLVSITMPVDAVDEADARESCLDLLARAIAKGSTQKGCREWLREHATVTVTAEEPDNAHD